MNFHWGSIKGQYCVAISLFILFACKNVFAEELQGFALKYGVNEIYIQQEDGSQRRVLIEIPRRKKQSAYPVVFGFHGAGGKADIYHRRLEPYVKKYGIITVSPEAALGRGGIRAWNFKENSHSNADDIQLVHAIIELLRKNKLLDESRVYATGASSGGLMVYRLARDTSLFSAIAPTKSGMAKNAHEPRADTKKLSILQVIGDKDKSFRGSKSRFVTMYSVKQRIQIWSEFNQCGNEAGREYASFSFLHFDCAEGTEVELVVLKGVGHKIGRDWAKKTDAMIIDFFLRQDSKRNAKAAGND